MSDPEPKPVLSYSTPPLRPAAKPSALAAVLLALPGLLCWMAMAPTVIPRTGSAQVLRWPGYFLMEWLGFGMILVWFLAVLTAIASLLLYLPRPKPWYVILNLIVNISGLLFTLLVLAFAWLK